ncbi:MAG: dTDP-glucose 4,6-dehydratase [Alphaproteobacteria bacterium]|nr:dTDP-glucose 4,6-dehydratase [Alphaproteobacteria bacterium]
MTTFLVTGGAGFIGSNFVLGALSQGVRVVNLDALTYAGNLDSLADVSESTAHVFVHGSINDRPLLDDLFAEHRPDAVINLAAESHVDRSIDTPETFVATNVDGAFTLLEAALQHWRELPGDAKDRFRLVHVSTDEVYGSIEQGYFTESSPYAPSSPYAASKAAADHLARAYHRTYGFPAIVTNCGNNYGPRQFPEKLIPLMILNALDDKPLPLYGDGGHTRDWIHVEDHCSALMRVITDGRPGETYLIGGAGGERTNRDVVERLCGVLDEIRPRPGDGRHAELIARVTDRPGHDRRYAIDAEKTRRELGWQPEIAFEDGLRQTVRWYIDNRSWWEKIRAGSYRGERLGLDRAAAGT